MNLSKFAVKRPVTITMMILIIVLFGIISLTDLPIDLYPEIEIPVVIVSTSYQGVGPKEMENLITKKIEGVVATVSNIDTVNSITSEGNSIVVAQFGFGTDMDFASLDMREKVDLIKGSLPSDATDPLVMRIDPNATPIIQIAMSSKNGDLEGLQTLAEDNIRQRFEKIEGVASVDINGGLEKEIQITVDPWKLNSYGLNLDQVSRSISGSNMNIPGGNITMGDEEINMRIVGEFDNIEQIKKLPIILNSSSVISLEDIADIKYTNKEASSISRVNNKDSVSISIQKQSGTNTVKVADNINKELKKIKDDYDNIEFYKVLDTSTFIKESINNVKSNVIIGSIFAVLVLYIFLKNLTTTFIVGISIPISLIASFILLYLNNITLNMMTLGGLALAVGMLVDSAIVVLENIYRLYDEGLTITEASIEGAKEVAMSITASTLTTIAVFLPIVFVQGVIGIIFRDFALTVTLSLIASLVVALTFIPMLTSKLLKKENKKQKKLDFIYKKFDKVMEKIVSMYLKILNFGLHHRKTVILTAVLVFSISIISLIFIGFEFFPETDEGIIDINISLPVGSTLDDTNMVVKKIEDKVKDIEEVETYFSNVGSGTMTMGSSNNFAKITLSLVEQNKRELLSNDLAEKIRKDLKDIPGAEINISTVTSTNMGMTTSPIAIRVKGTDMDMLDKISKDIKAIVSDLQGTVDVDGGFGDSSMELEAIINKDIAAAYGLTTNQIAMNIRNSSLGSTVSKFRIDGDEIDIKLKAIDDYTESLDRLNSLEITSPLGIQVPIDQVVEFKLVESPVNINRENQERVVTVTSQLSGRDLASVVKDIEESLEEYDIPEGYSYEIGGENEDMIEAFGNLFKALLIAVLLIYMIMAAQFESLIHPFIIMFTIPLAFGGGILGLFITNTPFGVTAFIGIIMLSGIVVNNGIVLIDYINQLCSSGLEIMEAISKACPTRLRPILMTTLTTILGLVPLALGIGEGAEIQAPMAIVVISGLLISTVLTLVFIPVLYLIFETMASKFKRNDI